MPVLSTGIDICLYQRDTGLNYPFFQKLYNKNWNQSVYLKAFEPASSGGCKTVELVKIGKIIKELRSLAQECKTASRDCPDEELSECLLKSV